jgi:hypothetical protein
MDFLTGLEVWDFLRFGLMVGVLSWVSLFCKAFYDSL